MRRAILAVMILLAFACAKKSTAPTPEEERYLQLFEEGVQALKDKNLGKAEQAFREQAALEPKDATPDYNLACAYALSGRREDALQALERSLTKGWDDADHMTQDTDLESLWQDPKFLAMVERLRADQKAFEARWERVFDPSRSDGKSFPSFSALESHFKPLFRPLENGEGWMSGRERQEKIYTLAAEKAASLRRLDWQGDPEAFAALIRLFGRYGNFGDQVELRSLFQPFLMAFPDHQAAGEIWWLYGKFLKEKVPDAGAARLAFQSTVKRDPKAPWAGRALMELAEDAETEGLGDEALRYAEQAVEGFRKDRELGFEVTERMRTIILNHKGLPPITAPDWDGKPVDFADYKGKVLMIDFWATWCGPCVAEVPFVAKARTMHAEQGFEVVGISLDEKMSVEALRKFCKEKGMNWRQVYEGKGWDVQATQDYFIRGIPTMLLVDREGKVHRGARGEALVEQVGRLVGAL